SAFPDTGDRGEVSGEGHSRVHAVGMSQVGPDAESRDAASGDVARAAPRAEPTAGLASSFEDFFELEDQGLFGALCLLTGSRADAEDLLQLAFLKVWERWGLVQGLENPTGYLYRTAMNAHRSQRRRALVAARRAARTVFGGDPLERVDTRDGVDR